MTVHRNEDRWDRSNAVFENGVVTVYDKAAATRDPRDERGSTTGSPC